MLPEKDLNEEKDDSVEVFLSTDGLYMAFWSMKAPEEPKSTNSTKSEPERGDSPSKIIPFPKYKKQKFFF